MSTLVLHFCGPHRDRTWSPLYHRLDAALTVAREARSPLLIAGDAFEGRAVAHYAEIARARGVTVFETFDSGARTLTDARAALRVIRDRPELADVDHVLVVTDDWHVDRAMVMLAGERRHVLPERMLRLHNRSTDAGPRPPPQVKLGERRGIEDYLAGRPYNPFGEPFGKPKHPNDSDN